MGYSEAERERGCPAGDIRAWESVSAFDGVLSVMLLFPDWIFAFIEMNVYNVLYFNFEASMEPVIIS